MHEYVEVECAVAGQRRAELATRAERGTEKEKQGSLVGAVGRGRAPSSPPRARRTAEAAAMEKLGLS